MIVGKRQQSHAVADLDALGPRRHRPVQHLGRRAVRELAEEMMLDGPEVGEPDFVAAYRLGEHRMIGVALRSRAPWSRNGDLIEQAKFERSHGLSFALGTSQTRV